MFVVEMSAVDHDAYQLYLMLPTRLREMVRGFVRWAYSRWLVTDRVATPQARVPITHDVIASAGVFSIARACRRLTPENLELAQQLVTRILEQQDQAASGETARQFA